VRVQVLDELLRQLDAVRLLLHQRRADRLGARHLDVRLGHLAIVLELPRLERTQAHEHALVERSAPPALLERRHVVAALDIMDADENLVQLATKGVERRVALLHELALRYRDGVEHGKVVA